MHTPIKNYTSIEEILEYAIKAESDAEQWYLQAMKRTSDPELKHLLQRLAAMEAAHAKELLVSLEKIRAQQSVCQGIMLSYGESWQ